MNRSFWIVLGMITLMTGCIGGEPEPMPPEMQAQMAAQAEQNAKPQPVPTEAAPVEQAPGAVVSKPPVVEKAQPGVGMKGSRYGGGMVTEPVSQYFRAGQAVTYNIQIPNGLKTFRAMHDRNPRDWDEFEREILKPAHLQLPELPPGKEYFYDPTDGELKVKTVQ